MIFNATTKRTINPINGKLFGATELSLQMNLEKPCNIKIHGENVFLERKGNDDFTDLEMALCESSIDFLNTKQPWPTPPMEK